MGKYELKEAKTGYMFNLLATNGQVIATSEIYSSKEAAVKGIVSVGIAAAAAGIEDQTVEGFEAEKCPKFELYKDAAGEFRFRLKAINGQTVAVSEGYKAKASAINGIESVKANADGETVEV